MFGSYKKLIVFTSFIFSLNLVFGAIPSGHPDASSTGINGVGLTTGDLTTEGTTTVSVDGTVIDKKLFTGRLTINADNVTVQNSQFQNINFFAIDCNGLNTEIKDCTIIGPNDVGEAIQAENTTVLRCDISGYSDGIKANDNTIIQDSYIHDLWSDSGVNHCDAVQVMDGEDILIKHNSLLSVYQQQTSSVFLKSDLGTIDTVTIDNNYMYGGSYLFYTMKGYSNYAIPANVSFINNIVEENSYSFGIIYKEGTPTITCNVFTDGSAIPDNPECDSVSIVSGTVFPSIVTNDIVNSLTFEANVTSSVSITSVTADLSSIGGSSSTIMSLVSGDLWRVVYNMPTSVNEGNYSLPLVAVNSAGNSDALSVSLDVVDVASAYLPTITNISPTAAYCGDVVILTGSGFGDSQGSGDVFFNDVSAASINSWNNNQISAIVPTGDVTGFMMVSNHYGNFDLIGDAPTSAEYIFLNGDEKPLSGKSTGTWFGSPVGSDISTSPYSGANCVKIEGQSGNDQFIVYQTTAVDVSSNSSFDFYLKSDSGSEYIDIRVSGYDYNSYANSIIINSIPSTWTHYSVSMLDLTNGNSTFDPTQQRGVLFVFDADGGTIYVDDMKFPAVNEKGFTSLMPVISSFSPTSVNIGDTVVISGSNFSTSQGSGVVYVNGVAATTYNSWNETNISFIVPAATSGTVTVVNGCGNSSLPSTGTLLIAPPNQLIIDDYTPKVGYIGESVVITGSNFGSTRGTGFVDFNGIQAVTYSSWSDTSITVIVPAGTSSGPITVSNNAGYGDTSGSLATSRTDIIYDGESAETDLNSTNEGPLYTSWWYSPTDNSFVDSTSFAHSGTTSGYYHNTNDWSGGAFTLPLSIDVSDMSNFEFWIRGENGGETLKLTLWDENLDFPAYPDGRANSILLTGLTTSWTKYSYTLYDFTNGNTNRHIDMTTVKGFFLHGSLAGTGAFVDDILFNSVAGGGFGGIYEIITNINIFSVIPSSALVGDTITIYGSNFYDTQGVGMVYFNGVPATNFSSWNNTNIVVQVPIGATTGFIYITNHFGLGGVSETSFTVDAGDTTAPVIVLTGTNVQTIEVGSVYNELGATASDDVDGDISANIVIDSAAVDTNVTGSYSVTYNVSDSSSNSATEVIRTVNVVDTTIPVITLNGSNPQDISVGSAYIEAGATALDNYDGDISASIVKDSSAVDTNTVGSYTVTYDVADANGNNAIQVTRAVDVVDTTKPVITLNGSNPQDITAGFAYTELGATAIDNYDGDISSSIIIDSSLVDINIVGSYSVTYDVTDSVGNAAVQVTRIVNVTTDGDPVITLNGSNPQNIEVGNAYVESGATANDAIDGNISALIIIYSNSLDTNVVGSYSVDYVVTDSYGNTVTNTRTVNVVDTVIPVVMLAGINPQNIEVGNPYSESGAAASDNYDGDISASIIIDTAAVDTNAVGSYSVTYDVADSSGNNAIQVVRTVNVVDTTIPVITLAGNNVTNIYTGQPYVETGATAFDNYDGDISGSIVKDSSAVDTNTVGSYSVTYNVTDANGNNAEEVTRTVNVLSDNVPVIVLNGMAVTNIALRSAYTELGAVATDDVDGDISGSIIIYSNSLNTNMLGSYNVDYVVTDSFGNIVTNTRIVNIVDVTVPVIYSAQLPADGTITNAEFDVILTVSEPSICWSTNGVSHSSTNTNLTIHIANGVTNFSYYVIDDYSNSTGVSNYSYTVDTISPGTTNFYVIDNGSLDTESVLTVEIDFGETVTGFESGDVILSSGEVANIEDKGNGLYYMSVENVSSGMFSVSIKEGAVTDIASNINEVMEANYVEVAETDTVDVGEGIVKLYPRYFFINNGNNVLQVMFKKVSGSEIDIIIYNSHGEEIKTISSDEGISNGGNCTIEWNGTDSNGNSVSGIYFFVVETDGERNMEGKQKIVVLGDK